MKLTNQDCDDLTLAIEEFCQKSKMDILKSIQRQTIANAAEKRRLSATLEKLKLTPDDQSKDELEEKLAQLSISNLNDNLPITTVLHEEITAQLIAFTDNILKLDGKYALLWLDRILSSADIKDIIANIEQAGNLLIIQEEIKSPVKKFNLSDFKKILLEKINIEQFEQAKNILLKNAHLLNSQLSLFRDLNREIDKKNKDEIIRLLDTIKFPLTNTSSKYKDIDIRNSIFEIADLSKGLRYDPQNLNSKIRKFWLDGITKKVTPDKIEQFSSAISLHTRQILTELRKNLLQKLPQYASKPFEELISKEIEQTLLSFDPRDKQKLQHNQIITDGIIAANFAVETLFVLIEQNHFEKAYEFLEKQSLDKKTLRLMNFEQNFLFLDHPLTIIKLLNIKMSYLEAHNEFGKLIKCQLLEEKINSCSNKELIEAIKKGPVINSSHKTNAKNLKKFYNSQFTKISCCQIDKIAISLILQNSSKLIEEIFNFQQPHLKSDKNLICKLLIVASLNQDKKIFDFLLQLYDETLFQEYQNKSKTFEAIQLHLLQNTNLEEISDLYDNNIIHLVVISGNNHLLPFLKSKELDLERKNSYNKIALQYVKSPTSLKKLFNNGLSYPANLKIEIAEKFIAKFINSVITTKCFDQNLFNKFHSTVKDRILAKACQNTDCSDDFIINCINNGAKLLGKYNNQIAAYNLISNKPNLFKVIINKFPIVVEQLCKFYTEPVFLAIELKDNELLEKFLSYYLHLNFTNSKGLSPLQFAVQQDNSHAIKSLLKTSKSKINYRNKETKLAIDYANSYLIYKSLLLNGSKFIFKKNFSINFFHDFLQDPTIDKLHTFSTSTKKYIFKELILHNQHEILKNLLSDKSFIKYLNSDLDEKGNSAVALALGNIEMIQTLTLYPEINFNLKNFDDEIPLKIFFKNYKSEKYSAIEKEKLLLLLEFGADVTFNDEQRDKTLKLTKYNTEVLDCLDIILSNIENHDLSKMHDFTYRRLIFRALDHRKFHLVEACMAKRPKIEFCTKHGDNIFHLAINNHQEELIDIGIKLGHNLNFIRKSDHLTPLYLAVKKQNYYFASKFLQFKANYNYKPENGYSLLDKAREDYKLQELLLANVGDLPNETIKNWALYNQYIDNRVEFIFSYKFNNQEQKFAIAQNLKNLNKVEFSSLNKYATQLASSGESLGDWTRKFTDRYKKSYVEYLKQSHSHQNELA